MATATIHDPKADHTPGPWHASKGGHDRLIYAESETAFDLAIVRGGGNDAETDANARLIAAAPDLRLACQRAARRLHDLPRYLRENGHRVIGDIVAECLADCNAAVQLTEGD
jgi:hypothetical protein